MGNRTWMFDFVLSTCINGVSFGSSVISCTIPLDFV